MTASSIGTSVVREEPVPAPLQASPQTKTANTPSTETSPDTPSTGQGEQRGEQGQRAGVGGAVVLAGPDRVPADPADDRTDRHGAGHLPQRLQQRSPHRQRAGDGHGQQHERQRQAVVGAGLQREQLAVPEGSVCSAGSPVRTLEDSTGSVGDSAAPSSAAPVSPTPSSQPDSPAVTTTMKGIAVASRSGTGRVRERTAASG